MKSFEVIHRGLCYGTRLEIVSYKASFEENPEMPGNTTGKVDRQIIGLRILNNISPYKFIEA
jgi:hypothetical protein